MTIVSAEARLRARNQITLPEAVAEAAGLEAGDVFMVELRPDEPDTVRLHRIRKSYAGALTGVYGDTRAYLDELRNSWDRD